ncbi:MAG: hypothetical protein RLZZ618_83 [Pseudomonadota bacterium]|jgi:hypothetical protein
MTPHQRAALSTLLSMTLVACGGGGSGDGDTQNTPPPPAASTCTPVPTVRIELYGDSTQAGYQGSDGGQTMAANRPVVALQHAMDLRFGAGTTVVVSKAVGSTTAQTLVSGDGVNAPWPASISGHIVVINHGLLDMTHYGGPRFAEYALALAKLAVVPPGVQVVFETPNAAVGWDVSFYAQAMREVAAAHHIPVADAYAYHSGMADWQAQLGGDWAHPTDPLYLGIITHTVAPTLAPLVAALRCEAP